MKYRNFCDSMALSRIILGCDSFGSAFSEKDAVSLMDKYVELGGNTLDTARMYGRDFGGSDGDSERTIGKWIKSKNNRHDIFISSKCSHPYADWKSRLSKKDITEDVEKSLIALQTDYIDILWLHRDCDEINAEEITASLEDLKKAGKIRAYGASNWKTDRIKQGKTFFGSQVKWALALTPKEKIYDETLVEMDEHEYKFYKDNNMSVFAYASQAKGFFQKLEKGGIDALSPKARDRYLSDRNLKIFEDISKLCKECGYELGSFVAGALTANTDFPTFAIVGCKTDEQLAQSMAGADYDIDYEKVKTIIGF